MPAALVEQLGVDRPCPTGRSTLLAHIQLQERGRARAAHVELRERGLVEQAGRRGGGRGTRPRSPATSCARPSPSRPRPRVAASARAQPNQLTRSQPAFSPSAASRVGQPGPDRPSGAAAGRPSTPGAGRRCRSSASTRPAPWPWPTSGWPRARRSAGCPCGHVVLRRAVDDPLGHHLADAAGRGQAVHAEAGRHPEAAHRGLAEQELAVRRERLRRRARPWRSRRRAAPAPGAGRLAHDSANLVEVGLEQRARLGQRRRRRPASRPRVSRM